MPINIVHKLWGTEYWEVNTDLYCMKILVVAPGRRCSLHRHLIKDETFLCRVEEVIVEMVDSVSQIGEMRILRRGESIHIPPLTWHRFSNVRSVPAMIEEISTHHD